MKRLTGLNLHTEGKWYAPKEYFINNFKSVVKAVIVNDSSSCGDWDGYIIQRLGKSKFVMIVWSQSNCYPNSGFDFSTQEEYEEFSYMPSDTECLDRMLKYYTYFN